MDIRTGSRSFQIMPWAVLLCLGLPSCSSGTLLQGWYRARSAQNSVSPLTLKELHMEGPALLNQEVLVSGKIIYVGKFSTYLVLEEERVRLLVDLSKTESLSLSDYVKKGQAIRVVGSVQSGEKGHLFVVATSAVPG